jgi:SAM-dependent methyltransferase
MVTTVTSNKNASALGELYDRAYAMLCGTHPNYRFWHFQYLFLAETHAWQKARTAELQGHVLDVGCGRRPYEAWTRKGSGGVTQYTGLDLTPGPGVDILVGPQDRWPLDDASVDCIVFTQVLEHVSNRPHLLSEMARVLRPDGHILLTVPFIFMAHGLPHDYARFTVNGVRSLFEADYEVTEVAQLGRAGAVIGNLLLTFIDTSMNASRVTRIFKGLLLPLWIPLCALVNAISRLIDRLDRTGVYYANVGMIARRKGAR